MGGNTALSIAGARDDLIEDASHASMLVEGKPRAAEFAFETALAAGR